MKKMTYLVMALALVLGFTQCKKEQAVDQIENEGVHITLNVSGNNGGRAIVDPNAPDGFATVTFTDGDVIYVGNNGKYCGYLTFEGSSFGGMINPSSTSDYLHFYFMGNKGPQGRPSNVVITDQTNEYPVISYAPSTELYTEGVTSYSAKLQNKCAIVKFTVAEATNNVVTLRGMNNTVAIDFSANNAAAGASGEPYSFSSTGKGEIMLHAESETEQWGILLPQAAMTDAQVAIGYTGYKVSIPEIVANTYVTDIAEIATQSHIIYPEYFTDENIGEIIDDYAMIAYVGHVDGVCENGLAISLTDIYEYNATFAEATGDVILSSWDEYHPSMFGEWRLPSEEDWQYMMWGYYVENPVAQDITDFQNKLDAVGTKLVADANYWTSTEVDVDNAKVVFYDGQFAGLPSMVKTQYAHVRACLAF